MQQQSYLNMRVLRRKIFSRLTWVFHPISIFVGMQILFVTLISLWVVWFISRERDIEKFSARFSAMGLQVETSNGTTILVIGIVALVMVLVGSVLLFIWGQRQASFIRQQRSFVSSVTHELRTPLASMHLAYETLVSRALPEETRKRLLSMSLVDIDRLIRLVNQILISSRLDRGLAMFQDDITTIKVKDRLLEVSKGYIHLDANLLSRLTIDADEDLNLVISNNAFTLILGNLIENAIKYSSAGTPIVVSAHRENSMIHFKIIDKGIGLDRRERRKIFKMFFRGDRATLRAIPGTGLGLFIVKTSLEQLDGKISVDSEGKGDGSTFHIWLPTTT